MARRLYSYGFWMAVGSILLFIYSFFDKDLKNDRLWFGIGLVFGILLMRIVRYVEFTMPAKARAKRIAKYGYKPEEEQRYIFCRHCGLEQWEGYQFCQKCGRKLR